MMNDLPTFFFSHTRQDREIGNYLSRFVKNLEDTVAQYAAVDLQKQRLATIDSDIDLGNDWDKKLSYNLATSKTFVAIMTPFYFKRPSCGKELGVFLLRSPRLGIDLNGALTNVVNLLPIRWLPEHVYAENTLKDGRIPAFLRRVEDTPSDPGGDQKRTNAIRRYRRKGMANCVGGAGYAELLDSIAITIKNMPELKPAPPVGFAAAVDAFACDWSSYLNKLPTPSASSVMQPSLQPQPLVSVVAFFATNWVYPPDPMPVDFADQLILADERSGARDFILQTLLNDVRAAGIAEGLSVFHAAAPLSIGANPSLLDRLKALSSRNVLCALFVDPAVWPHATDAASATVEEVIRSKEWTGPIFLTAPIPAGNAVADVLRARGLPGTIIELPTTSDTRQTVLRQVFVDARGRLLRGSTDLAANAQPLPLLKGTRPEDR